MVATGAANVSFVRFTVPRLWSVFGSQKTLDTSKEARITVHFIHNGVKSTSLAVRIYIVPNETLRCPLQSDRNSLCFPQKLPTEPDGRIFGELTLSDICDDFLGGTAAYTRNCEAPGIAYLIVYDGEAVSVYQTPKPIHMTLVHLGSAINPSVGMQSVRSW